MRKIKGGGVYTGRGALIAFTYVQYQSGLYMITLQDASWVYIGEKEKSVTFLSFFL